MFVSVFSIFLLERILQITILKGIEMLQNLHLKLYKSDLRLTSNLSARSCGIVRSPLHFLSKTRLLHRTELVQVPILGTTHGHLLQSQ